jgi:hypothetical protein
MIWTMENFPAEYLTYFKDLLEGRAEISWHGWFAQNQTALQERLPRAEYLRLKFKMIDEAERLLIANGIPFAITPHAKRERYYTTFSPDVCDDKGRPNEKIKRTFYDGAFGLYMDGDTEKAAAYFIEYVKKIRRMRNRVKQDEELGGLLVDGESEFTFGDEKLGRMMLEPIADLELFSDQVDFSIFEACKILGKTPKR